MAVRIAMCRASVLLLLCAYEPPLPSRAGVRGATSISVRTPFSGQRGAAVRRALVAVQ
jgi:hypothetical protein